MMSTSKYLQRKQYFLKIFPWPWLVNPFQNGQVRGSNTAPFPFPGPHVVFQPMHAMHNPIFMFVAKPIFPLIVVVKQLEYLVI